MKEINDVEINEVENDGMLYNLNDKEYNVARICFIRVYKNAYYTLREIGIDRDDFVQECLIRFCKYYKKDKSSVPTFSYIVANSILRGMIVSSNGKYSVLPSFIKSIDDPENPVHVSSNPKSHLIEDIESSLSNITYSKKAIPAVGIFKHRMAGNTLDEISDWIFNSYGKKVTREMVRVYLEDIKKVIVNFLED